MPTPLFVRLRERRGLRIFLANRLAVAACVILLLLMLLALLAPWIYPADPLAIVGAPALWPGQEARFPMGTDALGRDMLAGLIHGARVSLSIGFFATTLGAAIGLVVGALAGYFGGRLDRSLNRLIEVFQTLPNFVLLIVLIAITRSSVGMIIVALGLVSWPSMARLARAQFRSLRASEFVMAGKGAGFSDWRLIFREILPNALPALIVTATLMVATAILMESALSFVGFGDPNVASWGAMIGAGREFLRTNWFLTAVPGMAIVVTVVAVNIVGDALGDALNPHFIER